MSDRFVSRGGLKLDAALEQFQLDVAGFICADLGCNVGGFTDCLLQRGAQHVHAIDTGYGQLAWKLRQDPRVTVTERTNALHYDPPIDAVDLVVIDLGWTRQQHAIPAALRWRPRHIITLIKPHYEASDRTNARGTLTPEEAEQVAAQVIEQLPTYAPENMKLEVLGHLQSPIKGGKKKGRTGNIEYLAHMRLAIA
jgi:23S rRNA (cytidine1920-2'-O)/16S rRNA (cytidine1409-2'-O)-methyltransferase